MKIFITGANGFVGTHLCLKLLEHGHTVYGLVRTPSKMSFAHPQFIIVKGDLNSFELPLDIDACIHTAGLVHSFDENDFFQVNANATAALIDILKNHFKINPLKPFKFILLSSLAAAGPSLKGQIKDEMEIDFPVSAYGRSKKLAEELLKTNAPKEWLCSIIRPPMVIGPGDPAILDIFKMVQSGLVLLPGTDSLSKQYSFVCVFDLVKTIIYVVESDNEVFIYSAYDSVIIFKQLIEEIKKQLKKTWIIYIPTPLFIIKFLSFLLKIVHKIIPHQLRLTPDKIFELKAQAWTCSSKKSQSLLGQTYQFDLPKTIQITLADYQKRHWL